MRLIRLISLILPLIGLIFQANAIETLPSGERKHGHEVQKAFEPIRKVLQTCSAIVLADSPREVKDLRNKDRIAYGTVMSSDGLILTKASELSDRTGIEIRVEETLYEEVEILATDPVWDLALLKIKAEGLVPAPWHSDQPEIGTWVVANGASGRWRRRVKVGIVSARSREVKDEQSRAVVGVVFEEEGMVIKEVHEKSGAAEVGILKGDRVVGIDGEELDGLEDLREKLGECVAGEFISLEIMRGGEKLAFRVELRSSEDLYGKAPPSRNDGMSGRYSERRTNFPWIMQHEIPFSRISAGGPLLDLQGRCIGLNIARANRAETFAIPTEKLLEAYAALKLKADSNP